MTNPAGPLPGGPAPRPAPTATTSLDDEAIELLRHIDSNTNTSRQHNAAIREAAGTFKFWWIIPALLAIILIVIIWHFISGSNKVTVEVKQPPAPAHAEDGKSGMTEADVEAAVAKKMAELAAKGKPAVATSAPASAPANPPATRGSTPVGAAPLTLDGAVTLLTANNKVLIGQLLASSGKTATPPASKKLVKLTALQSDGYPATTFIAQEGTIDPPTAQAGRPTSFLDQAGKLQMISGKYLKARFEYVPGVETVGQILNLDVRHQLTGAAKIEKGKALLCDIYYNDAGQMVYFSTFSGELEYRVFPSNCWVTTTPLPVQLGR